MLERISDSTSGRLTPSEKIRKMIHVEHSRRFAGVSTVASSEFATDFRSGRPRKAPQLRGERDE